MIRSLRPIASFNLSTATSISFIRKGSMSSLSIGRKKRLAADSVLMPRCISKSAKIGLMPIFSASSLAAAALSDVGGS